MMGLTPFTLKFYTLDVFIFPIRFFSYTSLPFNIFLDYPMYSINTHVVYGGE